MVFLFGMGVQTTDSNPLECNSPVDCCAIPAGRYRHLYFCHQGKNANRVLLSPPEKRRVSAQNGTRAYNSASGRLVGTESGGLSVFFWKNILTNPFLFYIMRMFLKRKWKLRNIYIYTGNLAASSRKMWLWSLPWLQQWSPASLCRRTKPILITSMSKH